MKTAIILGATGLTGQALLKQLLNDTAFNKVISFIRRPIDVVNPKLIQHTVNFNELETSKNLILGDVVFCCLGTTIKTAGSQDAFKKVDYTYPLEFAKLAKQNGVKEFYLQSSVGADYKSKNFYLKTKGELEIALNDLNFDKMVSFRPSMLLGNRAEFRFGELIGKVLMQALSFLFIGKWKRYKAIHSEDVAKAMIKQSKLNMSGNFIVENEDLINISLH